MMAGRATPAHEPTQAGGAWWRLLSGYQWFVFLVASGAWFFDCLDQRLFSLARIPALSELMHAGARDPHVQATGKAVTAFFLIGWGIGGMVFGPLGDRFGRARMLTLTILIYSVFTGLSFFSHTATDFTIFRFLTGVGVGGVFGLAVALIAETAPPAARVQALGLLQVLSTIGNLVAALIKSGVDSLESSGAIHAGSSWRWVFLVGAAPAAMVVLTGRRLREPDPWLELKRSGRLLKDGFFGPYRRLFADSRWRGNLVVGSLLASTGVIGLWGIGEYAVDLQRAVLPASVINQTYFLNMLGGAVGMWLFTKLAAASGRRPAFAVGFGAALVVTFFVYWKMSTPRDAYWMMPLMGAAQFSVFAGFSIYLPELFPSSLRSTGTSFCYNLGRFAAAGGSFFSWELTKLYSSHPSPLPLRYSAMTMCALFVIGLATLPFAPETRGKPLPQDDAGPATPENSGLTLAAAH